MVKGADSFSSNLLSPTINNEDNNSDEFDVVVASKEALLPKENRHKFERGDSADCNHRRFRKPSGNRRASEDKIVRFESNLIENKKMENETSHASSDISPVRKYASVLVLFLINLLNYMDRFTIAGVLLPIKHYFDVSNGSVGLLQTVFIISYMIIAPVFGYLGDRYNRKIVMLIGMFIWSGSTLFASFVQDKSQFILFLILRALVGIGEASYSIIAPTIIADMFVKTQRTRMLAVFFFATPVGSGLGYIIGSAAAKAFGSWQWALRVTPGLGLITMILLIFVVPNTKRGGSEASVKTDINELDKNKSSYMDDVKYLIKNRTFMLVTIGFTFMAFVVGSLTIWGPVFIALSQIVVGKLEPCIDESCEYANISFVFGVITCSAGFLGVWIGAECAKRWKERGNKSADAHVCAIALIAAAPLLFLGIEACVVNLTAGWSLIFFANLSLCLTWTLISDITLYVTLPNRRSTGQAMQILTAHLFGDAGSPYLIGVMSDVLASSMPDTYYSKYVSLNWSIYMTFFAAVLGGGAFLMASVFLPYDKRKVDRYLTGKEKSLIAQSPLGSSDDSVKLITIKDTKSCYNYEKGDGCIIDETLENKIIHNVDVQTRVLKKVSTMDNGDRGINSDVVHCLLDSSTKESDI